MKNKKEINLFLVLIAAILGVTLFKHIDFKKFKLQDPVLDILYLIVFIIAVYLLIKERNR